MRKAATSIVGALIVFLYVQPLFSQGIQSTIINLPLSGNWHQAADVEKDGSAPGVQVFYDQNTGTILQIRNDYQLRAVNEISQQFRTAGQAAAGPDGAKILMMSMFPLPNKYVQAISGNLHEGHLPKLWESSRAWQRAMVLRVAIIRRIPRERRIEFQRDPGTVPASARDARRKQIGRTGRCIGV